MSINNPACASTSRRNMLKGSITAAGSGLLAAKLASAPASASDAVSPRTRPFVERLPVYQPKTAIEKLEPPCYPVATGDECGRADHQRWADFYPVSKFYELNVCQAMHSFHPDLPTQPIWGYDGKFPGPTFVAKYGEPAVVRIYNNLPQNHVGFGSPEISTHLHNLHNGSESDGFTGDYYSPLKAGPTMTAPGKYKDHLYANCLAGYDEYHATHGDPREALGTLWYHDHRMDFTAPNVYRGLSGFYLLFDDIDSGNENDANEKALCLPSGVGKYDIPLVFHDKLFNAKGIMTFDPFNSDGFLGDKFCVNGKIQPYFEVERRKYRFRLLDGGPSRFYEFYLSYGGVDQPFTYIANDGNLLAAPLTMKKVRLGPAERADIVIDFNLFPPGSKLFLVNKLEQTTGRGPSGKILSPGTQLLRFDVKPGLEKVDDPSQVPDVLREQPPLPTAEEIKQMPKRVWSFDRSSGGWTVNGKLFDVLQVAAKPRIGTQELWVLRSTGNWSHPIHIHFEEGRILSRNGVAPPLHERGRKDVYVLKPNEELRLVMKFRDYKGKYMMHCHNLIHEDHAMMVRWDIVD
jgi:FtsP/CotA-like multicopper oxidase with cupredoxin domain